MRIRQLLHAYAVLALLTSREESESIEPSAAIMIGDRHHDIAGAKENGLRTVGILWSYGSRQELEDAGADVLCEAPKLLHDCIVIED